MDKTNKRILRESVALLYPLSLLFGGWVTYIGLTIAALEVVFVALLFTLYLGCKDSYFEWVEEHKCEFSSPFIFYCNLVAILLLWVNKHYALCVLVTLAFIIANKLPTER